jgi:hypothetical protein
MKYVILALGNGGRKLRLVLGINPANFEVVKVFDTYSEAELFLDLIVYKIEGIPSHIIVPFPVDRESALVLEQATARFKKSFSSF